MPAPRSAASRGAHGTRVRRASARGRSTTYTYDVFGNLTKVELPNADIIEYTVDGQNRRVAKKKNGTVVKKWIYRDQLHPVAELNPNGSVVKIFVYASGKNSPDYMVQGGTRYRIFSDHLGSPRVVVDDEGVIQQRMLHDEFGNVTKDTQAGFTPFGFAGGLYDPDTGLVPFGARDYDPVVGRWISKDPIRFEGLQSNLYGYVSNDPINGTDPSGYIDWVKFITGTGLAAGGVSLAAASAPVAAAGASATVTLPVVGQVCGPPAAVLGYSGVVAGLGGLYEGLGLIKEALDDKPKDPAAPTSSQ